MAHLKDDEVVAAVLTLLRDAEGEGALRAGLAETPQRVKEAWRFWLSGYGKDPLDVLKTFEDGADGYDEMITVTQIPVHSTCEHHAAPFFGYAHIGYIPNRRVLGLSKFARLVDIYARRLQVQERLTVQIADALWMHLKPKGVGVILECRHMCMETRGVRTPGSITRTNALRGVFTEERVRGEFLSIKTERV